MILLVSNHYHPIHVFPDEGSYNVTLTVSDSLYQDCKKEFSSYINVESYFKLWVPNSFTPNNDGVNDSFKPVVIGVDYYELIITNRWGEIASLHLMLTTLGMDIMLVKLLLKELINARLFTLKIMILLNHRILKNINLIR